MFQARSWKFASLLLTLLVCANAIAATPGVIPANDTAHVETVEVTLPDTKAPAAFAIMLHDAVAKEAAFYGDSGRPIVLKIALDKVHYKNALKAMIIGDDNQAKGHVVVLDQATGDQAAAFIVRVDAERPGGAGRFIAMSVLGAFDPTGLVDIGSAAGSATSADTHRASTAAAMSDNFATETLRQTFGDAKARVVKSTKQKIARSQHKG